MSNKRRHLFISHHHKDDAEVSKLTNLLTGKGIDVRNSSVRMKPQNERRMEEKRVNPKVIERILSMKISWANTVIVLIGKDTHKRDWVNWEIEYAAQHDKRIVGVFLRGGTDADIPESLTKNGDALVAWNSDKINRAVNGEDIWENPDGSPRREPIFPISRTVC